MPNSLAASRGAHKLELNQFKRTQFEKMLQSSTVLVLVDKKKKHFKSEQNQV